MVALIHWHPVDVPYASQSLIILNARFDQIFSLFELALELLLSWLNKELFNSANNSKPTVLTRNELGTNSNSLCTRCAGILAVAVLDTASPILFVALHS